MQQEMPRVPAVERQPVGCPHDEGAGSVVVAGAAAHAGEHAFRFGENKWLTCCFRGPDGAVGADPLQGRRAELDQCAGDQRVGLSRGSGVLSGLRGSHQRRQLVGERQEVRLAERCARRCECRSSNNYRPRQHPEKLIPRFLGLLLTGQSVTVHGRGRHIRNWLHVEDNCRAIEQVLRAGVPGETYNIGGGTDLTTIELTKLLLEAAGRGAEAITYVPDRPANDIRYSMTWDKIAALGFTPTRDLAAGLADTIAWYRRHPDRLAPSTAVDAPNGVPA